MTAGCGGPDASPPPTTAAPSNLAGVDPGAPPVNPGGTGSGADRDPTARASTPTAVDGLRLPRTPDELTGALGEAELAVRDPAVAGGPDPDGAATRADPALLAAWGRRQQVLYRVLAAHPEWADEVTAGVDPAVAPAVAANWRAQKALLDLVLAAPLSPTLPAWTIREPAPAANLLALYQEAEAATGVPWETLAAIHLVETRMSRIDGASSAGAVGPMQFLPSTWAACCQGDPTVDAEAIMGAAVYLVSLGAPGAMDEALRGYNNSEAYVTAIEAYSTVMTDDPAAYGGYHGWEVIYQSSAGLIRLPAGYQETEPVDAAAWVAARPDLMVMPAATPSE
ncbi:MAG: lytic transglycosylase domain-containing protein [Acidimicrobiales bacterium]